MISAVFFDYDGVLTRDKTGSLTTHRFLSEHAGLPYAHVARAFAPYNDALNTGKINYADIWSSVCAVLAAPMPLELLMAAFQSTPVNAAMFSLARALQGRCALGIITDNKKDRMDCLRRSQRLDPLFAPIVVSAEVGHTKESPEIFRHALRLAQKKPEESVFIDNTRENLAAADAIGMRTIHFDDERNDVEALARRLEFDFGICPARDGKRWVLRANDVTCGGNRAPAASEL